MRSPYAGSQHVARSLCVEEGSFRFFLADQVFPVVEDDECVILVYELMFAESHFLNVTGHPYVDRCDVLVDESIVGDFVIDVTPEIVGRPDQS